MKFGRAMPQDKKITYYRQQAREYIDAFNARDMDRVLAVYAENATVNDPKWGRSFTGKVWLRPFYEAAFQRATLEIVGPVRSTYGNAVAAPVLANLADRTHDVITVTYFDEDGLIVQYDALWGPGDVTMKTSG